MDGTATGIADGADERHRWAFTYSVNGDLRFISHLDTLRTFQRALARASLPVRFSEGFNPHPRIMIPLPRPVGVASDAEMLVVEFEEPIDPEDALLRLDRQTPTGMHVSGVRRLSPGETPTASQVRYRLQVAEGAGDTLASSITQVCESDETIVERNYKKGRRPRLVNIRPYLAELQMVGDAVEFSVHVTQNGTAKPSEIAGLLGYDPDTINHQIRRMEIQWR